MEINLSHLKEGDRDNAERSTQMEKHRWCLGGGSLNRVSKDHTCKEESDEERMKKVKRSLAGMGDVRLVLRLLEKVDQEKGSKGAGDS